MASYTGGGTSGPDAPEDGGSYRFSKTRIATAVAVGLLAASLTGFVILKGCPRKPEQAPKKTYQTAVQTAVCRASDDIHYEVIGRRIYLHGFDDGNNPCVYEMTRDNFCNMYKLCEVRPTPSRRKSAAPKPKPPAAPPTEPPKQPETTPAAQPATVPKPVEESKPPEISRYPVEVRKQRTLTREQLKNYRLERCSQ